MIGWFEYINNWSRVKRAARSTISKDGAGLPPDDSWKKTMLLAEHSPIRRIWVSWRWVDLKSWVSVHFVRHWVGISHWVSTQRTDRTGTKRDKKPQDSPVCHECDANAQALINISRRRLCSQASPETRAAWQEVVDKVKIADPVLGSVLVPECIYRGFCPEFKYKSCGYDQTEAFKKRLAEYRNKEG